MLKHQKWQHWLQSQRCDTEYSTLLETSEAYYCIYYYNNIISSST